MNLTCYKKALLATVLIGASLPVSRADVMVSNMDQPTGGGIPIAFDVLWFASSFVTDNAAPLFSLENVILDLGAASNTSGGFFVSIYSDLSNHPGLQLEQLSGTSNPATAGDYAFTSVGLALTSNTKYWIVAGVSSGPGTYSWNLPTTDLYTGPWTIPTTATHAHSETQGAVWDTGDGFARQFSVSATPVPEPATCALLGLGFGLLILSRGRRN